MKKVWSMWKDNYVVKAFFIFQTISKFNAGAELQSFISVASRNVKQSTGTFFSSIKFKFERGSPQSIAWINEIKKLIFRIEKDNHRLYTQRVEREMKRERERDRERAREREMFHRYLLSILCLLGKSFLVYLFLQEINKFIYKYLSLCPENLVMAS